MTFRGRVKNGVVVLDPPASLPEGSLVEVSAVPEGPGDVPSPRQTLAERYADVIGIVEGLPADLSVEHDHYIHGSARRDEQ
jgi:hypothetical protein